MDATLDMDSMAEQFSPSSENTDISEANQTNIIKVIGVGGGGNNAVSHMYKQNIKDVSFVVLNTDLQALKNSPVPTKLQIGSGLGAGNKPEVAREAAENDVEKIRELLDTRTKMVFITAGMGGGTGTGAAPVVAREAKARNILTVGIVTIPFRFEGDRKILKALEGVDEMAKHVDALLVINNERLTEIYGDLDFLNAFGKADDTLSTAASSISELITADGYMNLDFNDVDTTLRDGGAAIISSGYGEGENRVTKAIQDALHSPLLKNRDILTSKRLLFNIYYSRQAQQQFKMSEAQEITDFVNDINADVDVIWGVAFDDSLGEKVRITILAAGFELTVRDDEADDKKISASGAAGKRAIKWGSENDSPTIVGPATSAKTGTKSKITDEYGEKRHNYIILTNVDQMDDDVVIERLEQTPTLTRTRKDTELTGAKAEAAANRDATPSSGNKISF